MNERPRRPPNSHKYAPLASALPACFIIRTQRVLPVAVISLSVLALLGLLALHAFGGPRQAQAQTCTVTKPGHQWAGDPQSAPRGRSVRHLPALIRGQVAPVRGPRWRGGWLRRISSSSRSWPSGWCLVRWVRVGSVGLASYAGDERARPPVKEAAAVPDRTR